MDLSLVLFVILGVLSLAGAIGTVVSKSPVSSAISLVFHFFMLAGIYLTLQAQFIAVLQVLVYAGAIMVLVIFVIMLLNLGNEEALEEKFNLQKLAGLTVGLVLLLQLGIIVLTSSPEMNKLTAISSEVGTVEAVGKTLFTYYLFPFEAITLLLLVAVVGALILARRKNSNEQFRGDY